MKLFNILQKTVPITRLKIGSDYGYAWPDTIQIKGQFVIQTAWIS